MRILRKIKESAKRIPYVPYLYYKFLALTLRSGPAEVVFTDIFRGNKWGGKDSASGMGSDVGQTRVVVGALPIIFDSFNIRTVLDIPCGDFHWMQHADMAKVDYMGADIVADLIQNNTKHYEKESVHFRKLDIIKDALPCVDLIFCRDCLVHLSYENIFSALDNICNSDSIYLLTTTFTARRCNYDIATGQWRALNLELAPFGFPKPLRVINEECTESEGAYRDKSLGLWKVSDIRACLANRRHLA